MFHPDNATTADFALSKFIFPFAGLFFFSLSRIVSRKPANNLDTLVSLLRRQDPNVPGKIFVDRNRDIFS